MTIRLGLIAAAASAALLAACGGGGNGVDTPAASDAVPASANKSAEGMVRWMNALAADDTETKEPLDVSRFTPPKPEDTEPVALR